MQHYHSPVVWFILGILALCTSCSSGSGSGDQGLSTDVEASDPDPPTLHPWPEEFFPLQIVYAQGFDTRVFGWSVDANGNTPIDYALAEWDILGKNFFLPPIAVPNKHYIDRRDYAAKDRELGIYGHNDWFPEIVGKLQNALAMTFQAYSKDISTGRLSGKTADIVFNYRDHRFSTDPSLYPGTNDFPSVLVHEIGHLLGLGHQYDLSIPSVMHEALESGTVHRELTAYDIESIESLYSGSTNAQRFLDDSPGSEVIFAIHALYPDGECHYYENGQLVADHGAASLPSLEITF